MFRKTTLAAFALLLSAGVARAAAPAVITYSGFLLDGAGSPVTGPTQLTFRFYGVSTGGLALGQEDLAVVPSSDGYFSAVIGAAYVPAASAPAFTGLFESPAYMSVQLQGEAEMTPRIQITSVPSAMSVDWSGITGRPESSCSGATPFVTGIDLNGRVTCGAAPAGVITSVTGAGPIAVSAGATPQVSLTGCASADQILKWNGSAWACAADAGSSGVITGVTVVAPLVGGGTSGVVSVSFPNCGFGQILKMGATSWACLNDADSGGTITGVTAGIGLTDGGSPATPPGAVSLAVNFTAAGGDNGGATTVSRGDHLHDVLYFRQGTLQTAGAINAAGNPVDWSKLKGVPAGFADGVDNDSGGTITGVTVGAGLTGGGTTGAVSVGLQSCASGQILKMGTTGWACAADLDTNSGGTVTGVTATSPLASSGGTAPNITIGQATSSASGFLSATDWSIFNGKLGLVSRDASLSGAGTTASPLAVAYGGSSGRWGTAATAARSDHSHGIYVTVALSSFIAQYGTPTFGTTQYGTFVALPAWNLPVNSCIITSSSIPMGTSGAITLHFNAGTSATGSVTVTPGATGVVSDTTGPTNCLSWSPSLTATMAVGQMHHFSATATGLTVCGVSPVTYVGPGDTFAFRLCNFMSAGSPTVSITSVMLEYP